MLSLQGKRIFTAGFWKVERNLMEKNASTSEILTKRRVFEMKKVREMYDFRNMWSHDSKMLLLDISERKKVNVFYDW